MNRAPVGCVPDLTPCAREAIHVPQAIQSHGALLVASADGNCITHASANLAAILGAAPEDCLDRPPGSVLGSEACDLLLGAGLHAANTTGLTHTLVRPRAAALHLRAFRSGRSVCIDIEPVRTEPWQRPPLWRVQSILDSFRAATGVDDLCRLAVTGLRAVTGYDRVMGYRFGADGHGEVIAEDCAPLEPYLGQRYPASDIPAQARQLYLRQPVGVIADSGYTPVPLLGRAGARDHAPIDLTHSALRSVSPLHREFMRNMHTAASMTIGLASGGASAAPTLWGMLVCHHLTPRYPSPELRAAAEVIGQVVSLLLHNQMTAEVYAERARRDATLRTLLTGLTSAAPPIETLLALGGDLLRLVNASGAVVRFAGNHHSLGAAPGPQLAAAIGAALRPVRHRAALGVDDLGLRHPEFAAEAANYSGVLVLPLGETGKDADQDSQDAILWFRPEQALTITWGGDPTKHPAPDPVTGTISPRSSFAAWKEIVHGHSRPWSRADLSLAEELRQGIELEIGRRAKLSLDLFDRIFESSPTALVLLGRDGEIKMLNREAERLFGYERAELQSRPFAQLIPERLRNLQTADIRRYLDSGEPVIRRKDGGEFPVEVTLSPISPRDLGGHPMLQASIVDITQRRHSEAVVAQARIELEAVNAKLSYTNQELDQFVYTASHDLRSPLRAIVSLTQFVLEDDENLGAQTKERVNMIAGRARRLERMLNDVLLYARAGKGSHQSGAATTADRLVDEVVATLQLPAGTAIVKDPSLASVEVMPAPLAQILQNLIGNSIKHHDRTSGTITLAVTARGSGLRFTVSDDGPGIAPAYRETVFNMFTTLKRRDEVEASGIGLALVRKLVTLHGGNCGIESAPVRGTRVWFDWSPASDARGAHDASE
jgi:PAS domain S-box-containing protein